MTFEKENRYLLTEVISIHKNPLHEKIVGHICELSKFSENEFGWFHVFLDDGKHTICTSIVNEIRISEDGTVTVTTSNSVYHFTLLSEPLEASALERMCAGRGV
jgi:hypothetical protein